MDEVISSALLNGIVFNDYDEDGVFWGMDTLEGWGSPGTDSGYEKKVGQHGAWRTNENPTLVERSISIGGTVKAPTHALRAAAAHKLKAAITLSLSPFTVIDMSGEKLTCQAERDGDVLIKHDVYTFAWSAQLKAPDPLLYGESITVSTGLPQSVGGTSWPRSWPMSWTGVTSSGIIVIDNPGDIPSPTYLRFDGPLSGPFARHINSGKELVLASDYQLLAGSWLDVDMQLREVLEGGTASRNGTLYSRGFFKLDPGINQIVFGHAGAYNSTAKLTLMTTPTYQ